MKKTRRVIESGVVTAALAITAAATAVSGNVKDTSQSSKQANNETVFMAENKAAEGASVQIATAVPTAEQNTKEKQKQDVTAELLTEKDTGFVKISEWNSGNSDNQVKPVDSQGQVADNMFFAVDQKNKVQQHLDNVTAQKQNEEEKQDQKSAWDSKMMANVENNMNVRAEASEDAEIVGKLYKGAAADVVEKGETWTKIKSGNVEGYVKNEFCVFGDDAKDLANKICKTYAKSTTEGLRVRDGASTDAKVLTVMAKSQCAQVDTSAEATDGWVAVKYGDQTGYISSDYAQVSMNLGQAMTLEEEQKMIEKQEAEKRAAEEAARKKAEAEQAKKAASQEAKKSTSESSSNESKSSTSVSTDSGISSSVDDVTLLAALIYCEAGAEPYEGQLAVGAVVVNRVQSSVYPNTISEVIYQKGQFTPAASGKLAKILAQGASDSCYRAAREALSGVDNTGGAIGFHAGKGSGTVIGNQTFF